MTRARNYPASYHAAARHLVAYGAHGGDIARGRAMIAKALRDLRLLRGRPAAVTARYGLLFISGCFPVKPAFSFDAWCDARRARNALRRAPR